MQIAAKTPEEYLSKLEEPRRTEIEQLHKLILKTAPMLTQTMAFGMIGYGTYRYKYASGREGEWVQIALASQKNYISLYATCVTKEGKYLAESYKSQLPKASIGKSCIRFKHLKDIDLAVITEIVKKSAELYKKDRKD